MLPSTASTPKPVTSTRCVGSSPTPASLRNVQISRLVIQLSSRLVVVWRAHTRTAAPGLRPRKTGNRPGVTSDTSLTGTARGHAERVPQTSGYPWLARAGLLARGVVFGVIGILALKLALGDGGKATNQQGALQTI